MWTSLRFKIVATLAALVLLTGLWQVWFSYSAARMIIEGDAIRAVGMVANARRQALRYELEQQHYRIGFLLERLREPCASGDPAWCRQMLNAVVAAEKEATGAQVMTPQSGRVSAGEWHEIDGAPLPQGQLARFERDEQGRPYYVMSTSLDRGGTLSVRFGTQKIESVFLSRKGLGESGESFLTDARARFLTPAKYASASTQSHPIGARPMEMCLLGQSSETIDKDYRGIDVIHGFRHVPEVGGGCIMVHLDQTEAFAPAAKLRDTLFLGAIGFGLVAIVLGVFAARVLSKPILTLSETASRVTGGALDARAPVTTSDEVGSLTRAFNMMLDALQASEQALRTARSELEVRVQERTADLVRAVDALKREIAEREQAERTVRSYATRLEHLQAVDRGLLAAQSPDAIGEQALHHVRAMIPCTRASITMFDFSRDEAVVSAVDGRSEMRFRAGSREPLSAFTHRLDDLRQGRMWLVPEILDQPRTPLVEALTAIGLRSFISIPLISQGQLVGTLNLGWETPHAFSDETVAIAGEVATGVALGLHQVRLHEEIQQLNLGLERKVKERTEEIEAFTYSVSHDLRVPLRAVDAFSRILEDEYAACMDPEGRRLVGIVRANARSMGELIEGLLALSRLGSQEMSFSEIDLGELAARVFDELRAGAPTRHLQFGVGRVTPAWGDRAMIRQVLANLLSNAIKFTATRDPAEIELGEVVEHNTGWYYVRDNGVGFDGRYAGQLFGAFQRLHAPEQFEGSGVGLAIVRRIVERHGGRVRAEGTPDRGATIYFALPPGHRSVSPPPPPNAT